MAFSSLRSLGSAVIYWVDLFFLGAGSPSKSVRMSSAKVTPRSLAICCHLIFSCGDTFMVKSLGLVTAMLCPFLVSAFG